MSRRFRRTLLILSACSAPAPEVAPPQGSYLYLWTVSADSTQADFLAVLDVTEDTGRYGRLVTTLPVPGRLNVPHHTEHEMPADRQLFANGFATGRSWIFDLTAPAAPRIVTEFGDAASFSHPHSFVRLPNGNVLATYQVQHAAKGARAGGLVEMTPAGVVVRSRSADGPGMDPALRVYSAAVVQALDRIMSTSTDMNGDAEASRTLQVWRMSDLSPVASLTLPGEHGLLTAEPRILKDGRRLLVSTFSCGLFLVENLDTNPTARQGGSFPRSPNTYCAIPVVSGDYYLVTVPALKRWWCWPSVILRSHGK